VRQERYQPIIGAANANASLLRSLVVRAHNAVARSPLRFACDTRPVRALMDPLLEMHAGDVLAVARAIASVTGHWWVAGGWGVDALVGLQTRRHRDLDIVVDETQLNLDRLIAALAELGLDRLAERRTEGSIAPRRVWLADRAGHSVDLLPVDLDRSPFRATGDAPAAFTTGVIAGEAVPCLSAALQFEHHRNHRHRSTDRHDLRLLDADAQPAP
jgi:lincosamide nucleotidyltransferase A/C/D/E